MNLGNIPVIAEKTKLGQLPVKTGEKFVLFKGFERANIAQQ